MAKNLNMRQRAVFVLALLLAACGVGWAVSAQAFATGTVQRATGALPNAVAPPPLPKNVNAATQTAPAVAATNAHCGETITTSLTLNGDLSCPSYTGADLVVKGTSTTLNLNGFSITGDASTGYTCVIVTGASDVVENGALTACGQEGVLLQGSKTTLTKTSIIGAYEGVFDAGSSDKISANTILHSKDFGIWEYFTTGASVTNNRVASAGNGIEIAGTSPSTVVTGNSSDSNTQYGIEIDPGSKGTFASNSADYNASDGIYNYDYAPITDGGGNTAHGNDYVTGTTPEQCKGISCS